MRLSKRIRVEITYADAPLDVQCRVRKLIDFHMAQNLIVYRGNSTGAYKVHYIAGFFSFSTAILPLIVNSIIAYLLPTPYKIMIYNDLREGFAWQITVWHCATARSIAFSFPYYSQFICPQPSSDHISLVKDLEEEEISSSKAELYSQSVS